MRGKGFTLIELLITISILAVLMTIAIISYSNVQKNGRDNKRKADLATIQAALEQYHADQGYYPTFSAGIGDCATLTNGIFDIYDACQLKSPSGVSTYINNAPKDPTVGSSVTGAYYYTGLNKISPLTACNNTTVKCVTYCLYANLEGTSPGRGSCPMSSYNFALTAP